MAHLSSGMHSLLIIIRLRQMVNSQSRFVSDNSSDSLKTGRYTGNKSDRPRYRQINILQVLGGVGGGVVEDLAKEGMM